MTVDEIRLLKDDFLKADTVAGAMHMDIGKLRYYARTNQLPFPVQISGNTMKFSRIGFLNWVDGKKPEPEETRTEKLMQEIIRQMKIHNLLMEAYVKNQAPVSFMLTVEKIKEVLGDEGLQADENHDGAKVLGAAV